MDRSVRKILSLPIFHDQFIEALVATNMASIEKVLAFGGGSPDEFASNVLFCAPGFQCDESCIQVLIDNADLLALVWSIVTASKSKFLDEVATDLGYGLADHRRSERAITSLADAKRLLAAPVDRQLAKVPRAAAPSAAVDSLRSAEESEKHKWALRLDAIAARAGASASININQVDDGVLSEAESNLVKFMVFSAGAFRTIRAHVRHWERLEAWAGALPEPQSVYPLDLDLLVKYALHLSKECGPTVIPSVRAAVRWICRRIGIAPPDTEALAVKVIEDKVIELRGEEIKEAVPIPVKLVELLEIYFARLHSEGGKEPAALFVWWVLVAIFASLRFDDACHVCPDKLEFTDQAMYGVVWQTKVERKRKGTRFAVANASISGVRWLPIGFQLLQRWISNRDYFLYELGSLEKFAAQPPTYVRSLKWVKYFCSKAISDGKVSGKIDGDEAEKLSEVVRDITWHSVRVTLLNAAVHEGADENEIGLQANWKNPGPMVLKYARDRRTLPLRLVARLCSKMKDGWSPGPDIIVDDEPAVTNPLPVTFYVKRESARANDCSFKFHSSSLIIGCPKVACGKLKITDCEPIGDELPDVNMLCAACAKVRPDLAIAG